MLQLSFYCAQYCYNNIAAVHRQRVRIGIWWTLLFGEHLGNGLPLQKSQVCTNAKKVQLLYRVWQQLSQAFLDRSIVVWQCCLENVMVTTVRWLTHRIYLLNRSDL